MTRPRVVPDEVVYDGEFTRVTRVVPDHGGPAVIRKESLGAEALEQLRHERAVLHRLAGVDGVPQLVDAGRRADAIEVLDTAGRRLDEALTPGAVDAGELVRVALAVTHIVGAIHRRGVLHRDLNPTNILLTEPDREPLLVDFHLASLLSDERLATRGGTEIVGTLAYLAPEQSGRTGRIVDQRADLYALGATLYELATGRPPFGRGDPLRLVHDHLARMPTAPAELDRRIPRGLSDIVMRLLEKDPDARYQSAEGLAHDLTLVRDQITRDQITRDQTIRGQTIRDQVTGDGSTGGTDAPLVLGTRDFPQRLPPPSTMVGRDAELATLRQRFTEAVRGHGGGVLIAGGAGVGKGALVERLRPAVTGQGGWMVNGRFDRYRQDSRSDAVWQALRALGRSLLTESDEDLAAHRKHIRAALGHNAGLIVDTLPEFGVLLDVSPQPAAGADAVLAERRLQQASVDLIRAVVATGRPLVLVLDDLQWAGPTALNLVDTLLLDDLRGLLVVGTYRDDGLEVGNPLTATLTRWRGGRVPPALIRLSDLSTDEQVTFLTDMLRLPQADAAELANQIRVRSHGNPYDTVELINSLRRDGALVQQDGGWSWEADTLRRYIGQGDVVDLLAARLDALPRASVDLLEVMACLGSEVELVLLADANATPVSRVEELLAAPMSDGLVAARHAAEPAVRFRHDRVLAAVSGRLAPARRTAIHRTVARRLAIIEQFVPVAAEQYLAAIDTIREPDEIRRVVDLFRRAARDVRLINPATAERLLSAAIRLLWMVRTLADTALVVALRTEQHGVLNLLGRHDELDRVFAAIERDDPDPQQLAESVCVQVSSLCDRGREAEGVALGLGLLRRLGLEVPDGPVGPPAPGRWAEFDAWGAELDLAEDLRRPAVTDPRHLAIAHVIEGLTAAAFFSDPAVVAWLVLESQRLWVRHGPSRSLAATLGLTGAVTTGLRRDYRSGYPILRHVLAVCEAREYEPATSFVRGCIPLFASHWFEPVEHNIGLGRQARDGLMKAGYLQSACYTYATTMGALLDTSPTVDALDEEVEPAITLATSTGNSHAAAGFVGYRQLLRALRGQTDGPGSFTDDSFDESEHLSGTDANPVDASVYRINRALSAAIFGDLPTLVEQAAATMPLIGELGGYREALAYLFQSMALAQRIRATDGDSEAMLAELDQCRDWLAARAADAPANFLHLVRLVDAERAWAVGDNRVAASSFDAALLESQPRSRPWHRALIAERAALHYLDLGLEYLGHVLITEAWRRYEAWGANAKVSQLERAYPFLRGAPTVGRDRGHEPSASTRVTSDALDLIGLLQTSQALSSERNLDRLRARVVDTLSELTGATSVQVLLSEHDGVDWVKPSDGGLEQTITVEEAAARGMLPLSAFRYAQRTREPLLVDDATRDHRFAGDPYLRGLQRCSLLIVPVRTQGEPRAMLVLENSLSRGAFSTDRLDAVNLIVGQLSVSLDNALIYSSLERKVSERTKELEIANGRLEVLAVTDPLTGLANRRRLIEVLEVELLRSLRTGGSTGVTMIDIDYFKAFNDRYGHVAGDECLRRVAEALHRSVRATDVIARYGGEEFAVVLPQADLVESGVIAERARAAVAALHEPHPGSPAGIVTVSVGIAAQTATRQTTVEQVLAAADARLYEAKRGGRNQVRGLSPPPA